MNTLQVYALLLIVMVFPGFLAFLDTQSRRFETLPTSRFELVWHEDFENDEIDESVWSFNIGDGCPNLCGWGNAELQYYRKENAFIEDGDLVIEARRELFTDPESGKVYGYTSARLDTIGKLAVTPPARIEVRAKLPSGKGLWPAIWMLGEEWSLENVRAWPSCGEIDIMELIGSEPNVVHGTIHAPFCYGGRGMNSWFKLPAGQDFSQDYHVFALEWTRDYIAWFVDNQLFHVVTRREFQSKGCSWVFDKPFHLLLNIAVGGYWPGKPDDSTPFPARMRIDYIRVYRVLEPDPLINQTDDSDNEILVKTRGWPSVSQERIINGNFDKPVNMNNHPLLNPDDWFLVGNTHILDNLTTSNGVLILIIRRELENEAVVGLSQLLWIRQNVEYEVRVKAWSNLRLNATLEISLPSLLPKNYYSRILELKEAPEFFRVAYTHPPIGSNVVQLTLWIHARPGLYEETRVYFDEVEICPVNTCPYTPTTETTQPQETTHTKAQQVSDVLAGVLGVVSVVALILSVVLILKLKRKI